MVGVVKEIKRFRHKSYGWIRGTDKKTYWFNFNDCVDQIEMGDSVEFNVVGENAKDVQKCTI